MSPVVMHVTALYHYPVKSCAGLSLAKAEIDARGIAGDRAFMLVDREGQFLTQRHHPGMALIHPKLRTGALTLIAAGMPSIEVIIARDGPAEEVVVWQDRCLAVDQGEAAAAWFSELLGLPCRLMRMAETFVRPVDPAYARNDSDQVGFADGYPCLLISQASLVDLNSRLQQKITMNRFRPNIVVSGCAPYAEDTWRQIQIGEIRFAVVKPCARCVITTTDQATAARGEEPLRTLATYRHTPGMGVTFGQNLIHEHTGRIRVSDPVTVLG